MILIKFKRKHLFTAEKFKTSNLKIVGTFILTVLSACIIATTAHKMKFSIKNFFSKCDSILNEKRHFLCNAPPFYDFTTMGALGTTRRVAFEIS